MDEEFRNPGLPAEIVPHVARTIRACEKLPRLRSILIVGSFGKGYGQLICRDGELIPLRDLDVLLIFYASVPRSKVRRIAEYLNSQYESSMSDYYLDTEFLVEVKATTLYRLNHLPDLFTYDMKFSTVVWGEDIRPLIRWSLADVPFRTSVRALTQKGIAMIGVLDERYLRTGVPEDRQETFVRETSRAYQEIATGLCLAAGFYSPNPERRLEFLEDNFLNIFPAVARKSPTLIDRIRHWTKDKHSGSVPHAQDPIILWLTARDDLLLVLGEMSIRALGIDVTNARQDPLQNSTVTYRYYEPVARSILKPIDPCNNERMAKFVTILLALRDCLYATNRASKKRIFPVDLFSARMPPSIRLILAIPHLLETVNETGDLNTDKLKIASEILGMRPSRTPLSWNRLRSTLLGLVDITNFV